MSTWRRRVAVDERQVKHSSSVVSSSTGPSYLARTKASLVVWAPVVLADLAVEIAVKAALLGEPLKGGPRIEKDYALPTVGTTLHVL
jgi:hypothetical protein